MSKKHIESELCDLCEDALDKLSEDDYRQLILDYIRRLLGFNLSTDDVEWDMLAEREKFEPADTN